MKYTIRSLLGLTALIALTYYWIPQLEKKFSPDAYATTFGDNQFMLTRLGDTCKIKPIGLASRIKYQGKDVDPEKDLVFVVNDEVVPLEKDFNCDEVVYTAIYPKQGLEIPTKEDISSESEE